MHRELVERRRWISETRFLHTLNYCMWCRVRKHSNLLSILGWLMHQTWGCVVAGVLFVLPGTFVYSGLNTQQIERSVGILSEVVRQLQRNN